MKRREFIKQAVTGVAGAAAGVSLVAGCGGGEEATAEGPAVHTTKKVQWRLASSFPRGLDTIFGAAEVLANRVEAMTGGNFKIRVYPAGELVPGTQVLDGVQQRTVQVGHTASYYYLGKNPALAFDCTVPFGLTSRQQTAWLSQGGGKELMAPMFADFGLVAFPAGNTGAQMGGWFKREINDLADLAGLTMRIPGMGGRVMSELGATVQLLAGGDIYPALERGAIDATEWVGPYDDEKLGFHKVAKYYYYPGWWEPGPHLSYYVGQQAWDELPALYKEAFAAAAVESATVMQAMYDHKNPAALVRLLEQGVQPRVFSDDIMRAAREVAFQAYEDHAAKDPSYRALYDAWSKFREDSFAWWGLAELAYASFAFGGT
jgi:TRAP-type mannitol/chloroaromatic compound transport system substrate-binding protein